MRRLNYVLIFVLISIMQSCGNKVVEFPVFSARNSDFFEIEGVVLSDSATVINFRSFITPPNGIKIDPTAYIRANGEEYTVSRVEPEEIVAQVGSSESAFTLTFPAIPASIQTIDYIGSSTANTIKIYGIDLTGKATFADNSALIPDNLKALQPSTQVGMPKPDMSIGETTINIHLLGYDKDIHSNEVSFYINAYFPDNQTTKSAIVDDQTSMATLKFMQFGMNTVMIYHGNIGENTYIYPGENVDIYFDLTQKARQSSMFHKTSNPAPHVYNSGRGVNMALTANECRESLMLNALNASFLDKISGLNIDQYFDLVISEYNATLDSIKNSEVSPLSKELFAIDVKINAALAILNSDGYLTIAYKKNNPQTGADYVAPKPTKAQYTALKKLNLNDEAILNSGSFGYFYLFLFSKIDDLSLVSDDKEGLLFDLQKVKDLPNKVRNATPFTAKEKSVLASIKNPFYAEALIYLEKEMQAELDAVKDKTGYTIVEAPKVSNEKLFDAIAARYKGKAVLVDLWATWCGPCKASIKKLEPLKTTELKDDDLAFVYLTDVSSPELKWKSSIAEIQGDHYRLTKSQWDSLYEKFKIDGIPSYVIIQKDGSYELRNDLRNFDTMKATLKELL
ncbi:MAG: TlpA disulfide reductase family protein [Rikenellaceae bacterium]